MSFAIHNGSSFQVPPSDAKPDTNLPAIVRYPEHLVTASGGGADSGKPLCVIGRSLINQTGLNWYRGFIGPTVTHVAVTVRLLDLATGTWKSYEGIMGEPTLGEPLVGGRYYTDFRVTFTSLKEN